MNPSNESSLVDSFPFKAHLNSNYIPTDDEMRIIQRFLIQPTKQLHSMDHELKRLETELAALQEERNNLFTQLMLCRSLITTPRRLPVDILSEIFYQSLPADHNAAMSMTSAPLVFTRVCRHWREVAVSSTRLWSTIHVHVIQKCRPPSSENSDEYVPSEPLARWPGQWDKKRAAEALEWIQRSGNIRPLSISIVGKVDHSRMLPPSAFFDLQIKSILPFTSRWRNLFLSSSPDSFSRLASIKPLDLPCLESLFLDFSSERRSHRSEQKDQKTWKNCGLLTTPSLRKLSIRQVTMDLADLNINWAQLSHLDIGSPTARTASIYLPMSTASHILRFCDRLVYCHLDVETVWTDRPIVIYPMPLPVLRTLSIRTDSDIELFLEKLGVPALTSLNFYFALSSDSHPTSLANLLKKGTIHTLAIKAPYILQTSFVKSLQSCPMLTSLTVHRSPISRNHQEHKQFLQVDDEFLTSLSDDANPLCPRLNELTWGSINGISASGIMEFVRRKQGGRVSGLAKLKKLAIQNISTATKRDCRKRELVYWRESKELQAYITEGLVVQVCENEVEDFEDPVEDEDDYFPIDFGNSGAQYADYWVRE